MSPLVFSLVPRSHEWYACAEKHRMPVAVSIPFQLLFSGPRSSVMVCFAYFGTSLNRIPTASTVAALFFPESLVMKTSPVFLSTSVLIPGLWAHDSTVSPSQSPIRDRRSTIAGRSSMHRPSGFSTRWNRRVPCGMRRLRRLRRYTRRSSPPRTTEPLRICAYMNWYTASCETLSLRSIRILPAICSSESRAQETNATVRVSSLWSGATPSATARAPLLHAPPPSNADISYPAILAEWCTYLLNSLYVCFLGSDCRLYRISGYCRTVSRFVPYLFPVGLRRHRLLDPYIVVLQQRRVPPHRMGE